jgi:hypothetical protein
VSNSRAGNRGVRTDVEVRQRRATHAAAAAILDEALPCEQGSLPGKRKASEDVSGKRLLEFLDAIETDRHLGVDERIDRKSTRVGGSGQCVA